MHKLKTQARQYIPDSLFKALLPLYHWSRALAANVRYGFPARGMSVIGVTGTNGKTTSAVMIATIMRDAGFKVGLSTTALFRIGSEEWVNDLNMTTTDPFALMKLLRRMRKAGVDWVVLEVTSHALAQSRVLGVPFEAAVMTNLTQDHLDYHGSMDDYATAKAKLFKRAKRVCVLNRDDDWYNFFVQNCKVRSLSYGASEQADVRLQKANLSAKGTKLRLRGLNQHMVDVQTPMIGKFNAYNAMAAVTVCHGLGVDMEAIKAGLGEITGVPGRMEPVDTGQPFAVVVDYAHTPDAFRAIFETMRPLTKGRLIAVFGATGDRDKSKREELGKLGAQMCDEIYITDEEPYTEDPASIIEEVAKGARKVKRGAKIHIVQERKEAIAQAFSGAKKGDAVLLLAIGHQQYRVVGTEKQPWDERKIARELLQLQGKIKK